MSVLAMAEFTPIKILELELSEPIHPINAYNSETNAAYERAFILVRLHRNLLGTIDVELQNGELSASDCIQEVWQAFHQEINMHLEADGLPTVTALLETGLPWGQTQPLCIQQDEEIQKGDVLVSVIIATRNRTDQLERCLESLCKQDYGRYEVIIVDNAPSNDETANLIQRLSADHANLRYSLEPKPGLSYARNCGLAEAKGEIVAFTDDDVLVDSHWITSLVKAFNITEKVACVTGMVFPAEFETLPQWWLKLYGGFDRGFKQRIYDLREFRDPSSFYPYVPGILGAGANMAFDIQFLREIEGFDVTLGTGGPTMGGEDLMIFFQTIMKGYRLVYYPSAIMYHFDRREQKDFYRQIYGWGVGFTAFLTKCILEKPMRLFDILGRIINVILKGKITRHTIKEPGYPRELPWLERRGMLYGPIAYLKSWWKVRRLTATKIDTYQ